MMAGMYRLLAAPLLAVSLHAQPPTAAQLSKLYSQIDDVLGLRPGITVADIGTGFAVNHALSMTERLRRAARLFALM